MAVRPDCVTNRRGRWAFNPDFFERPAPHLSCMEEGLVSSPRTTRQSCSSAFLCGCDAGHFLLPVFPLLKPVKTTASAAGQWCDRCHIRSVSKALA